ncbi:MAG: response regulator transcription factor [Phycisphaerae bacterium]
MVAKKQQGKTTPKARLFLVDDHPIIRAGFRELLDQEPDMEVVGTAENAVEAMKMIEILKPDLAVVDISLNKDMGGLELIKDMKIRFPAVKVLVLSMHDETIFAERALRAGAKGYVMKEQATQKIITAVRKVLKGELYLNEKVASKILSKLVAGRSEDHRSPVEKLSDRELEVFKMIGDGMGTRDIAQKLHLSIKTVEAHRMHIREKLKLENGSELLQQAILWAQEEKQR